MPLASPMPTRATPASAIANPVRTASTMMSKPLGVRKNRRITEQTSRLKTFQCRRDDQAFYAVAVEQANSLGRTQDKRGSRQGVGHHGRRRNDRGADRLGG